jgi:hypothetical protein
MTTNTEDAEFPTYGEDAGAGFENVVVTSRDLVNLVLRPIDIELQLIAIQALLRRNAEADAVLETEAKALQERAARLSGWANDRALDESGTLFFHGVYQGAAHSMAAVGMIAPLTETVLERLLRFLPEVADPSGFNRGHRRWQVEEGKRWNCKLAVEKDGAEKGDFLRGVPQILDALGQSRLLDGQRRMQFEALFRYRNNMFHNGMEWPIELRLRFERDRKAWPDSWFATAETGTAPWIIYMTPEFVELCLSFVETFADSVGDLIREARDAGRLRSLSELPGSALS